MHDLLNKYELADASNKPSVLITVAHTAASAPREAGARMLVSADRVEGSIGGGNLEYKAIAKAREYLGAAPPTQLEQFLELYALGPMLEQCCGGVVFLHYQLIRDIQADWLAWLRNKVNCGQPLVIVTQTSDEDTATCENGKLLVSESETYGSLGELDSDAIEQARQLISEQRDTSFTQIQSLKESKGVLPDISEALLFDVMLPCDFHIALYGAGHVGKALINILGELSACQVSWIDSREDIFPQSLPANVTAVQLSQVLDTVRTMPANTYYLVMTHDHALDRKLCEAILLRDDSRFLGLIGSRTKLKRFQKHFIKNGISENDLSKLTCPIGIDGITSKEPAAIAVAVSAQLLQLHEALASEALTSDNEHKVVSIS